MDGPHPRDGGGVQYTIRSPFIDKCARVEILLPAKLEPQKKYPVLYILNESMGTGGIKGGFQEAVDKQFNDRFQAICVSPSFPSTPWYADHPTDLKFRQESFLTQAVVSLIESTQPALAKKEGRYLVGYSKSGFGAITLLLRNPDVFWKAASWDAPLSKEKADCWEMDKVYGSDENYQLYFPPALFKKQAALFAGGPNRFVLLGHKLFGKETEAAHALMSEFNIPHDYDNTLGFDHNYRSGWLETAVARLFKE